MWGCEAYTSIWVYKHCKWKFHVWWLFTTFLLELSMHDSRQINQLSRVKRRENALEYTYPQGYYTCKQTLLINCFPLYKDIFVLVQRPVSRVRDQSKWLAFFKCLHDNSVPFPIRVVTHSFHVTLCVGCDCIRLTAYILNRCTIRQTKVVGTKGQGANPQAAGNCTIHTPGVPL